ncbi:MAG: excinuclease ABC subunit UvrC [SAR324 cluster bacterium]|nr:excinuclease ABC subunit UvrC [SAR324 cluster bacterium]
MTIENMANATALALSDKLKSLPTSSGVYLLKDENANIIYIGKAKNLKNRVRSYFQQASLSNHRTAIFVAKLRDLEWIITLKESEALLVEDYLIKLHKPRYNILLKDSKTYPHIKVTIKERFPRLFLTRQVKKDGSQYYGPYSSIHDARSTLQAIHKYFPLRTSKMDLDGSKKYKPCLNFYLKRCLAPCTGNVKVSEYKEIVTQVIKLLKGDYNQLVEELTLEMHSRAAKQDFERASKIRDQIKSVKETLLKKPRITRDKLSCDLLGVVREDGFLGGQAVFIRGGIIVGSDFEFLGDDGGYQDDEVIRHLFAKLYIGKEKQPPPIIYVPEVTDEAKMLIHYFKERKVKIKIKFPSVIEKKKFYDGCLQNGIANLKAYLASEQTNQGILNRVKDDLKLKVLPNRVECIDISHLGGTNSVASLVVFENNMPAKKYYRRFKIKTVDKIDDFAAMAEVITRRIKRGISKDWLWPDLIIIDGGIGQLNAVLAVIAKSDLSLINFDVISFAKGRQEKKRFNKGAMQGRAGERAKNNDSLDFEYVVKPELKNKLRLNKSSPTLHFLQRVRDEAHRFALAYHKLIRRKQMLHSSLDDIFGIGSRKKEILLEYFGKISDLKQATKEELKKVPGITSQDITRLWKFFHHKEAQLKDK